MNGFPHYNNTPFRDLVTNTKFINQLRELKFNKNNYWNINFNDLTKIYNILDKINLGDKIIMYYNSPYPIVSKSLISNKLFRPILNKVFCGYSHYDFIDFLIELTIFHRINLNFKSREFKAILIRIGDIYPNEKNIFDALFKELI